MFLSNHVLGHVRGSLGLRRVVLISGFHKASLAYAARMHPLEQHYFGGRDFALASFGLEKVAIMSPAQQQAFIAAHRAKPTGLAAVQAQGQAVSPVGKPGIPLPAAPGAPMQVDQGLGGGPGMATGFGSSAIPLDAPLMYGEASLKGQQPSRKLPTSMMGGSSISGQAAQAEMRARAVPTRFNLPNKLAAFLLPTA